MEDKYKLAFKSKFWNTVDVINLYIELNEENAGISNHLIPKKTLKVYHFQRYLFCLKRCFNYKYGMFFQYREVKNNGP